MKWPTAIAAGVGLLLLLFLRLVPRSQTGVALDWTVIGVQAACAGLLLWRGARPEEQRPGWGWMASSFLVHAGSNLFEPFLLEQPIRLLITFAIAVVLMFMGIRKWFGQKVMHSGGIRRALDATVFALAVVALAWESILHIPTSPIGPVAWLVRMGNIVSHAILLGVALFEAQVDLRRLMGPLGWLCLYSLCACLNAIFALRIQLLGGLTVHSFSMHLIPLTQLPIGLAAFASWTPDALTREEGRGQNPWGGFLAYLPFGLAMLWMLLTIRPGVPLDKTLVALLGGSALVLLVRQIIAIRDQASFFRILQQQLDDRTSALEESQEAILRTQRLNLVATVGAGMAHDLNNLLGVVSTLAEEIGGQDELVTTAHRAAALAKRTLSHVENPGANREFFELGEAIEKLQPILRRLAGRKIELQFNSDATECWVEVDPIQIEQVLINLVTNARDALRGEGHIHITLGSEGDWALIEVEDDGPGVPSQDLDRIFDPFFTTKAKGRGTGLGLPSVKACMETMGGTVALAGSQGPGSRFVLRLPRIQGL